MRKERIEMKKILILSLAVMMLMSFTACSKKEEPQTPDTTTTLTEELPEYTQDTEETEEVPDETIPEETEAPAETTTVPEETTAVPEETTVAPADTTAEITTAATTVAETTTGRAKYNAEISVPSTRTRLANYGGIALTRMDYRSFYGNFSQPTVANVISAQTIWQETKDYWTQERFSQALRKAGY